MIGARVRNWDTRLGKELRALLGRPFEWGETDCGTLCRVALDAIYGPGAADRLLGATWNGPREALEAVARLGGQHGVLHGLGAYRVHPSYASAGDFVTGPGTDEEGLPPLMWITGGRCVRVRREDGVVALPLRSLGADAEIWRLPGGTAGGAL
jgi:hypothetical protein